MFLHPHLNQKLGVEDTNQIRTHEIQRLSTEWLNFVRESFKGFSEELAHLTSEKGFVLLISRPASTNKNQSHSPHPKIKKQMMKDLRKEIRSIGKVPVVLPHPTERNRFWHGINLLYAPGWQVIDKVHYLVLIEKAERIVTFGSQLVEDCWILENKAIEYRVDWVGDESRFVAEGKSQFCGSRDDLARALSE